MLRKMRQLFLCRVFYRRLRREDGGENEVQEDSGAEVPIVDPISVLSVISSLL